MSKELYHFFSKIYKKPGLQERWINENLAYLNSGFTTDLADYIKYYAKKDRELRKPVVNQVFFMLSSFLFLEEKYIDQYIVTFLQTLFRNHDSRTTYVFSEDVTIPSMIEMVQVIKARFPLAFLYLLDTFIEIAKIDFDDVELKFVDSSDLINMKSKVDALTEDDNPTVETLRYYLNKNLIKYIKSPSYKFTKKEKFDFFTIKKLHDRQLLLNNRINVLTNPDILYVEKELKIYKKFTDFKLFLTGLEIFFNYYSDMNDISLCSNCSKVFYRITRSQKSCSTNCTMISVTRRYDRQFSDKYTKSTRHFTLEDE